MRIPRKKPCEQCSSDFVYTDTRRRFCSLACASQYNADHKKNVTRYWLGKKRSPDVIEKMRNALRGRKASDATRARLREACRVQGRFGEGHHLWKGSDVSYSSLHKWVARWKGAPEQCERCGLSGLPPGRKRYFQWANISGKYRRDLMDWMRLCARCHKAYDRGEWRLQPHPSPRFPI